MLNLENIFYINLEKRTDRKLQIENEFAKMGLSGKRFDGVIYNPTEPDRYNNLNIYNPNLIGCQMAHLGLIKLAKSSGMDNIFIFEDDFQFIVDKSFFFKQISDFNDLSIDFDVLFLSYNVMESEPYNDLISYGRSVQTASGYVVNSNFYDKLIDNLEEGLKLHIETQESWQYCNDQYWKKIQKTNRFFYLNNRIGIQRLGYSDVMSRQTMYGV
jgi:GR25 family glycosyltransferase involved in LPS biosynthesis